MTQLGLTVCRSDFTFHVGGIPYAFNLSEMHKINRAFWEAFEQRAHKWVEQLVEGDIVSSRGTFEAVCTGRYGGEAVKGKKYVLDALTHHRIADGLVAEEWFCVTPRIDLDLPPNGEPLTSVLAAIMPASVARPPEIP